MLKILESFQWVLSAKGVPGTGDESWNFAKTDIKGRNEMMVGIHNSGSMHV
jgi:hypothetical protein